MSLTPGTRLGVYEVLAQIGEGGMGAVYRGTDTTLGRQVAIKILPDAFASDPERLARFEREAKMLASLNHSHIAAIYGFEKSGGTHALVMELVEGDDLSQRIARGAIPTDEALPIARQIAEALEAAHEQGIIHRDLKPANIKVRPDGAVKVLDFGLAKLNDSNVLNVSNGPNVSQAPTITTPALVTGAGVILGTAAYMSPEQARGKAVDKRADLWAFGAVLFEMLTGKRAFPGEDVTDTLAAVVKLEPDWSALPVDTPTSIRRVLRRCLTKDPRQRLSEATTVRLEIQDGHDPPPESPTGSRPVNRWRERIAWTMAGLLGLALVGSVMTLRNAPASPELRVDIATPPTSAPDSFALSQDGSQIAFVATSEGRPMLFVRSLTDGATRMLAQTEEAEKPFWSPDSRSIGFFALGYGTVKRIDLADGSVQAISSSYGNGQGGSWGTDGTILFARSNVGPLLRAPAMAAAEPTAVTTLDEQQSGHVFPWLLPDGRHFLYYARSGATPTSAAGLYVGAVDGATRKRLTDTDAFPAAFVSGHLVFTRQGGLIAQAFDATTLELSGEPFRLVEPGGTQEGDIGGGFAVSASATGSLAFRPIVPPAKRLVWFDRSGKELGRIDMPGDFNNPSLSPDGGRLLLRRLVDRSGDNWILDLTRGTWSPTSTSGSQPVWSPDGRRIAFYRASQGSNDFFVKPLGTDRVGEELVLATPELKSLYDWSPDGRFLLYQSESPTRDSGIDVWALPLDEPRTPIALAQTRFDEQRPQVSPDGRWIAYESNESGRYEIHAQPFPGRGERVRISTTGGAQVRWRRDGRELFYVGLDGRLMAVPLRATADGKTLEPGVAVPLFLTRIPGGALQQGGSRQQYVVSPDGQRFLVATLVDEATAPPITLILNWAGVPR